jgi:hypothetical protein
MLGRRARCSAMPTNRRCHAPSAWTVVVALPAHLTDVSVTAVARDTEARGAVARARLVEEHRAPNQQRGPAVAAVTEVRGLEFGSEAVTHDAHRVTRLPDRHVPRRVRRSRCGREERPRDSQNRKPPHDRTVVANDSDRQARPRRSSSTIRARRVAHAAVFSPVSRNPVMFWVIDSTRHGPVPSIW